MHFSDIAEMPTPAVVERNYFVKIVRGRIDSKKLDEDVLAQESPV